VTNDENGGMTEVMYKIIFLKKSKEDMIKCKMVKGYQNFSLTNIKSVHIFIYVVRY